MPSYCLGLFVFLQFFFFFAPNPNNRTTFEPSEASLGCGTKFLQTLLPPPSILEAHWTQILKVYKKSWQLSSKTPSCIRVQVAKIQTLLDGNKEKFVFFTLQSSSGHPDFCSTIQYLHQSKICRSFYEHFNYFETD